jgi:hypothetical protein
LDTTPELAAKLGIRRGKPAGGLTRDTFNLAAKLGIRRGKPGKPAGGLTGNTFNPHATPLLEFETPHCQTLFLPAAIVTARGTPVHHD